MAPTIMVARVAMQASGQVEDVRTAHLSDLEFRGQSNPSAHTTQILSHDTRARNGVIYNDSSEDRGSEKRVPIEVPVEEM